MRTIAHSALHTLKFPKQFMAFLIKIGYVISDETVSVGYANLFIDMIKGLKEGPLEYRLKMMRSDLDKVVNADLLEQISTYFIQKAQYDKIKHKTPDQLRWNFKVEHALTDIYKLWIAQKAAEMEAEGFGYLQKLVEDKKIDIQVMPEEGYKFDNLKTISLESIFNSSLYSPNGDQNILIMHDVHLNSDNVDPNNIFVTLNDPEATNTSNSWFHHLTTITNFNQLTLTEIMILRDSFSTKMAAFKTQLNQWIQISNTSNSNTESIQFFNNNIIPTLPDLKSFFNNEDVLKYYKEHKKEDLEFHMFIGEITKCALLNYYKNFMPLTEEVKQSLEEKFRLQGIYNKRIPVIIISRLENLTLPLNIKIYEDMYAEPLENEIELHKRKYLSIED